MTRSSNAVFLSYASEDAAAAQRLCMALRAAGIEVWFDVDELRGGDAWDQKIRRQIHDCALFIPVISAHSNARAEGYFRLEWKLAVDRSHLIADDAAFLVPVVIDDTPNDDGRVPDKFRSVQWTHLPQGIASAAFVERMARLLAPAQVPETGTPPWRAASGNSRVAAAGAAAPRVRRRLGWFVVAGAILVVLGILAVARLLRPPAKATALAAPQKSIAVLPFVDMSEKRDQEYFSDGLTEELIDHLAHAPDLKVIARTSSFQFKGKSEDVRTIAGKLGVANVLEGSVRKAGNELRITAQLIRAGDGVHLWSQTYDRNLKDIFKVQDEIATTVTGALQSALSPAPTAGSQRPANIDAYNLVLKGNFYFERRNPGDYDEAIRQYQHAAQLDPNYALAWAKLARTYIGQAADNFVPSAEGAAKAREAVRRALEIDPNSPQAHFALANIHRWFDLDWGAAIAEYRKVVQLDPYSEDGVLARAGILETTNASIGGSIEAIKLGKERTAHNPLDTSAWSDLAWYQYYAGQLEASAGTSRRVLDLNPGYATAHEQYAQTLLLMGKANEALAVAQRESDEITRLYIVACIQWTLGQRAESTTTLRQLEARYAETAPYYIAAAHAWRGETDAALTWLDRAYRQHDGQIEVIKIDPVLRSLHGDPRFQALLVRMKLAD